MISFERIFSGIVVGGLISALDVDLYVFLIAISCYAVAATVLWSLDRARGVYRG